MLYYRLSYVWGLLIIVGWFWTFFSIRNLSIERRARNRRQQVGQIFEERIEINNKSFIPRLFVEIWDESNLPGSMVSRVLTWLVGNHRQSYLAYTWLTKRGFFNLGPTRLSSGDLFGLFSISLVTPTKESLLVVPYMVDLTSFPAPFGLLPGGKAIRQRSTEVTPYAAGVREYMPGDSLNRIHWPTTVRRDMLMVKEFDQDPKAEVWIFVDGQKDVQAAIIEDVPPIRGEFAWLFMRKVEVKLPSATIEYSVSAAASIANYFIGQGLEVGIVCSGQVNTILSAERGDRQMGKILENLALIQPGSDLPIFGLVASQINHLPRGSTVVVITPSVDPEVALTADELVTYGMHPVMVLIDAASFEGNKGSESLEALILNKSVPVIKIANHDNIKDQLEVIGAPSRTENSRWWTQTEI
jgi:uncharacterized protein (DUF58 family)